MMQPLTLLICLRMIYMYLCLQQSFLKIIKKKKNTCNHDKIIQFFWLKTQAASEIQLQITHNRDPPLWHMAISSLFLQICPFVNI